MLTLFLLGIIKFLSIVNSLPTEDENIFWESQSLCLYVFTTHIGFHLYDMHVFCQNEKNLKMELLTVRSVFKRHIYLTALSNC